MAEKDDDKKKKDVKPNPVTPESSDPDLVDWLLRLFDGEFPERVEVVQLFGPQSRHRGVTVATESVPQVSEPWKQEKGVDVANHFLRQAQKHANTVGKAVKYAVLATNTRKSDRPYATYCFSLKPKAAGLVEYEGSPPSEFDDDEGGHGDGLGSDRLLRRFVEFSKDDRWRVEQYHGSSGQLLKMYQEQLDRREGYIKDLMSMWIEGQKMVHSTNLEMFKLQQDAKYQDLKLKMLGEVGSMVAGLLPHAVNKITGKQTLPENGTSPESLQIRAFLKSMEDDVGQVHKIFGKYNDDNTLESPGILTPRQTMIIFEVARGTMAPENLFALIDDGQDKVQLEQLAALQSVLRESQKLPLMALFGDITTKREAALQAQQAPSPSRPQAPAAPTPQPAPPAPKNDTAK